MKELPRTFFVTGTDTMVGKTFISAVLCRGLNAGYWKPIQSGTLERTDTECVKELTALPDRHFYKSTYTLTQPLSPHASAAIDGINIELGAFQLPSFNQEHLIIEGAGGLMVPLNRRDLMIDLIAWLNVPVLVVARSKLGTINHTLLTLAKLREYRLPIIGVVLNGPRNEGNAQAIKEYGKVEIIAQVEPVAPATTHNIAAAFHSFFGDRYGHYRKDLSHLASVHANENGWSTAAG